MEGDHSPGRRWTELSGWGGRPSSGAWVVTPAADELPGPPAGGRGMLARGLGRSYGDAALNAGGLVIDMTSLVGLHAFDPESGVVTVAAGTSIDRLLRSVLPFGWFVPVTPGTRHVTVGGAVAADIHGKNHHRDGSFASHVTSFVLRTPTGETLSVSPGDSPEVFWATAGGMGLTGLITEVSMRLMPVETSRVVVDTERATDLDDLMARLDDGDEAYRYSVAWIDLLARGRSMGRAVLTRGNHATADDLPPDDRGDPLAYSPKALITVPRWFPSGMLNRLSVRAFNEVWFRAAPREHRGVESIPSYFYPLDRIGDWNRMYGRRGFLQYQFAVPTGAEDTMRRVVERLSAARCPAFLAVLKRFGPQPGYLSFPLEGWTLALDVPIGIAGLPELLDTVDAMVAQAGGRVYLAKDSRMRPDVCHAMYPRLPEWEAVRDKLDPDRVMRSDLSRRLELGQVPA